MLKKILIVLLFLVVLVALALGFGYQLQQQKLDQPLALTAERSLLISKGTGFGALARQLAEEGLIDDPLWLRIEARLNPAITHIKAGEYRLEPGMSLSRLLEKALAGDTISYRFTFVEGMTFRQLMTALADNDVLQVKAAEMSEAELLQHLGSEAEAIEGLFLAETYHFERGMSDLQLLERAHADLNAFLQQAWEERAKELPYRTAYEALIMASIIERETGVPEERGKIAGVFVRRLERGMRLQTDPTVIYGMGERYNGRITRADLRRPTPWNTYVIDGLPPTPIAIAGREAIRAALHPEDGKALYFVAKGDGTHQFSNTLQEHNRAVREYQLQRRADYRSSPGG
jgi:UPF0755 protein